ncbi:MAG: hypothetical protein JXB07_00725 [Anaerolineae bacterium]|nr:hypothetical protein [Anaerolineae bacterium]
MSNIRTPFSSAFIVWQPCLKPGGLFHLFDAVFPPGMLRQAGLSIDVAEYSEHFGTTYLYTKQ